jgi:hypothetical protein
MISVSGVPFTADWQEIKDHMGQAGTVEFAEHLLGNDGRPKGVAFVRYATQGEAQNAIELLNGTFMPGKDGSTCPHSLWVSLWTGAKPQTNKGGMMAGTGAIVGMENIMNPAMLMAMMGKGFGKGGMGGPKKEEPDKKVRIDELPVGAGWQDLKDHMRQAGTVEYVKTLGTTGEVRYATKREAMAAVARLNGSMMMQGGPILVSAWA